MRNSMVSLHLSASNTFRKDIKRFSPNFGRIDCNFDLLD